MRQQEASYTVEMAVLMPIVLFVLLMPVYMGYEMCAQTKQASVCGWDKTFCAESIVWDIKFLEKMSEE